jgi:hypothetical protein
VQRFGNSVVLSIAMVVSSACVVSAQQATATQTARQALIEMFFSKTSGTLMKHLPAAMQAAVVKSGASTGFEQYSMMMNQFQANGHSVQTFETGSVLLSAEDTKTGQKFEIMVDNDSLRGDEDDIEVSFQSSKNSEDQWQMVKPQMTFSMKQEAQVWKLNEISATFHLPLTDPAFLKSISEKMHPASGTTTITQGGTVSGAPVTRSENPSAPSGSDPMVVAAMRSILTAERVYAATYPRVGYTCTLSDLDGFGGGEPNEHQAMLINSGLASGKRYGFVFTLSGCGNAPSTSFNLTVAPNANTFGRRAFCADQSAAIRSSADGNAATCLASGTSLQ